MPVENRSMLNAGIVLDRDEEGEPRVLRNGYYRFTVQFTDDEGTAFSIVGCRCNEACTNFLAPISIMKGGVHNIVQVTPKWQQKILDSVKRLVSQ